MVIFISLVTIIPGLCAFRFLQRPCFVLLGQCALHGIQGLLSRPVDYGVAGDRFVPPDLDSDGAGNLGLIVLDMRADDG